MYTCMCIYNYILIILSNMLLFVSYKVFKYGIKLDTKITILLSLKIITIGWGCSSVIEYMLSTHKVLAL